MKDQNTSSRPAVRCQRHEGHFEGHQGLELFLQSWMIADGRPARGTLVVTHGMGEHSECYDHTAEALVGMGWNVFAWDLRGHGRSEGQRGYVADFDFYARDLGCLLRHLKSGGKLSGPFALVGHSMGGLITLRHLLDAESDVPPPRAVCLSSPLLGVALAVPAVKDLAAKLLHRVVPKLTLFNEIKYEILTRDTELLKGYETDTLRHEKISPGVYLGMLENMALVKARAADFLLPTLIQAAGEDKVVSLPSAKEFYSSLGSKEKKLIVYEGNYHEIFNDLDRAQVYRDLDAFLGHYLAAAKGGT